MHEQVAKAMLVSRRGMTRRGLCFVGALAVASPTPATALAQVDGNETPQPRTTNPTAPQEPVQEVDVRGVRAQPGTEEVTGGEVKQLPGSFGDAFRAIEAMPGVTPLVSGVPCFLVRGAPPGNTGFFIDGVRVPALFHLGVGAAVVHPSLIDRVDFYPGAYPARFGRFTGGILSGEIAHLPESAHEEASIRLVDAGGLLSAPVADGRGDVLISGRYGYPGPLVSVFDPNVGLSYWDYQARARWKLSDHDQIGVFGFGSFDSLSARNATSGQMEQVLGIQFHRVDLRWDRQTSPTGSLRVALTLGYDRSAAGGSNSTITLIGSGTNQASGAEDFIESETIGLRSEWSDRLSRDADARLGSDIVISPYHVVLALFEPTGPGGMGPALPVSVLGATASDFRQVDVNGGSTGSSSGAWRPASSFALGVA
jgi:hypothetical protein